MAFDEANPSPEGALEKQWAREELYQTYLKTFFKSLPKGTASRIHHIMAYHYDAILREIDQETRNTEHYYACQDFFTEFFESSDLATFLNTLENND